ncbi:MAG: DNA topoisomerase IV subunit B [Alphaproteobacteria bacterium]|nr:DNA topoisomerase IV subunit B [Alphaproteobacteria bacterium]
MADLFRQNARGEDQYSAEDIEVLEGLEPVRRRPGMYIGGTDERAMHHLVAEVLDNAMDEAVAGHASSIDLELARDGTVTVRDNGRGIPIDPHPKFKTKSALEVVMTTLHSGGKFSNKAYTTSGGLHGVGISVVNALSDRLTVEVARGRNLWSQDYVRGKPTAKLKDHGTVNNRRGTTVRFHPDPEIFGAKAMFRPASLYRLARSKAYLYRGVSIRWSCDRALLGDDRATPAEAVLHFPGGLPDFLAASLEGRATLTAKAFTGEAKLGEVDARVEWAVAWPDDDEGFLSTYCNTVPTAQGGTHEIGFRGGVTRALKAYAELVGNRRGGLITTEDATGSFYALVSVFIRDPEFQGQTKEKLSTAWVLRAVETTIKDHFDHWLSADPDAATALLERIIARAEERLERRQVKEMQRKSPTRRLRLPGKLSDCARAGANGTEIFLVEGDSAGGSAKQARNRETQAVLPLRGKILNVASATTEKLRANQELADLVQALGCGTGTHFDETKLRYERVVIMTDADVDGAHIASLLMTFFYREMPKLILNGRLFLALPPLYRLTQGSVSRYAMDDADRDALLRDVFKGRGKVEISRFKGLGEMPSAQLRETTMDPARRTLLRVVVADGAEAGGVGSRAAAADLIERLMGRKPELRLAFIQMNAERVETLDV